MYRKTRFHSPIKNCDFGDARSHDYRGRRGTTACNGTNLCSTLFDLSTTNFRSYAISSCSDEVCAHGYDGIVPYNNRGYEGGARQAKKRVTI